MKVTLKDGAPRSTATVEINVSKNGNTLEIGATGVEPVPIVLEYYRGKLTLRVFGSNGTPDIVQDLSITPVPAETVESLLTKAIGHPPVSATQSAPVAKPSAAPVNPSALGQARAEAAKPTAQETVNAVFPLPATPEFDEAEFDAA